MDLQEAEIEVFKRQNEEHLDRFDSKFEQLSIEFTKIKTENIELKDNERMYKHRVKELEKEVKLLKDRCSVAEKYSDDIITAA